MTRKSLLHALGASLLRKVENLDGTISVWVKVSCGRTPQESLNATKREMYTSNAVNSMPEIESGEVEVVFFKPDLSQRNGFISDDGIEKEFELHGLKPASPLYVVAVNEVDHAFADEIPHGTYWESADGDRCYVSFSCLHGERLVEVGYDSIDDDGWDDSWWFAGVRK